MNAKASVSRAASYDVQLLFPVFFMVGIGIVMIYSASSTLALNKYGSDSFFLKRQAAFALAGVLVLAAGRHFPYRFYRPLAYPLLSLSVGLLVLLEVPGFSLTAGGAARWLRLGRFTFQPSELARVALVIYLAYSMEKKGDRLKRFSVGILPHGIVLAFITGLILMEPDFGSAMLLIALTGLMLFVGGVPIRHLAVTLLGLLPPVAYLLISAPYRLGRILGFLDPWQYPAGEGYQVVHSLMAYGTGGLWGTGIGKGYQKLFYLPEPHTDFIFSVIGEELGLAGVLVIMALYIWILLKGIGIARRAPDDFGSYLAVGLTAAIGLQVVVNMAVTLGLLPTKGLTLPFLSYGGSSLLLNMAAVGILLNIGAGAAGD